MAQPKIEGKGHGVPRMVFGSDGEHWYAFLVDSDGHIKVDVVTTALPTDAATQTTLAGMQSQIGAVGGGDAGTLLAYLLEIQSRLGDETSPGTGTLAKLLTDALAALQAMAEDIAGLSIDAEGHLQVDVVSLPSGSYLFYLADKDDDGDFDPLTAAAWEDSTKSGSGTINWNTVFGVPAAAKAVLVQVTGADDLVNQTFRLKAKSTAVNSSVVHRTQVANQNIDFQGVVPVAADGTSYYEFSTTYLSLWLRVVGWYK